MTQDFKLNEDFYHRNTVEVAKDLLGKVLVFGDYKGMITETEAYRGVDDEASHAFKGPTPRSSIMFGAPGYSYVYLIYGMYHCLNIVTESKGQAGAVLIRGLYIPPIHLKGPGKICQHLGISRQQNGINLVANSFFYLTQGVTNIPYEISPRIGIKKSMDKLWRFVATPPFENIIW